jgi:UDP-N-acetylglucosamine 2-epimerase (non-hydrolysing)
VLVHTGQHYDWSLSGAILHDLRVPTPSYFLEVGSHSLSTQTARAMERLEPVLGLERPDLVLVPGDVNSTLAAALVCAHMQIPYAHVESGLRSFDRTMPEEVNRIVTDSLADLLFVHCTEAIDNLVREGVSADRIHFVGNTMIDSLVALRRRIRANPATERLGVVPGRYLLVTLHRPSLVDGPLLFEVLERLDALARELPVLFPVHPRTRKKLGSRLPDRIRLTEPLGYVDFLSLQANAAAVLTDSGGIQEETTFLRIPCFTLRDNTERAVTVREGTNTLLGLEPERIDEILPALAARNGSVPQTLPELWDGRAAERIADVLVSAGAQAVPA